MAVVRRIGRFIVAAGLAVAAGVPEVSAAHDRRGPVVSHLAEFGSDDFVVGSTVGPDGALYVTDGVAGAVLRIDRRSGRVTPYAVGLPPKAFPGVDIGGPVLVAFARRTAYVLVTLVSGKFGDEPFGDPESAFAWVRDADAGTTIEKGDRLVPSTRPTARRPPCVPLGCRSGTASADACRFMLARMELTLIVARLAQRLVLVPTSPTVPRPDGVAVNPPAGRVPIRLRPRTLSNVEAVSPT